MASEWNNAVKTAFKAGRKTNKFYSLKDAMFDAKKIYKKGANSAVGLVNTTRRTLIGNKRRGKRGTRRGTRRNGKK
jgi:hypothetical protein